MTRRIRAGVLVSTAVAVATGTMVPAVASATVRDTVPASIPASTSLRATVPASIPASTSLRATVPASVPAAVPASAAYPYPVARSYVSRASTPVDLGSSAHWKHSYRATFDKPLNTAQSWGVYNTGGLSNPTTEWFSAKHVTVSGSQLHIKGYVDRSVEPDGRVVTGGLGLWKRPTLYGKYEILVRMPKCADIKYAWMLWPSSNRWPQDGEIDFAEDGGGNRAATTASLHASSGGQAQDEATPVGGLSAWHVIGVEWTPKSVRYTMDGVQWGKTRTTNIPHTPMVLVMQTEGVVAPSQVNLPGGSCNADVAWISQWKYHA